MRYAFLTFMLICCLLAPPSMAFGQGSGSVIIQPPNFDNYPQATAFVSVLDKNGIPVPDLAANAFEIVEDGRTSFPPDALDTRVNPDAMVSMALAIDLSGTMKGEAIQSAQEASRKLLEALIDQDVDPDRVAFFGIGRSVNPDDPPLDDPQAPEVPFGNDRNKVLNTINTIPTDQLKRPTPLWDSLLRMVKITSAQSGRRAIVVITDGVDTVSLFKIEDVIGEANRSNIPIFPIGLSQNKINQDALQRLAIRTGGVFRMAPSPEEFPSLFQQVLDQLKLEYQLTYQTRVTRDANPHSLLVAASSPRIGRQYAEVKFQFDVTPVPTSAETPAPATTPTLPVAPTISPGPTPTPAPLPEGVIDRMLGLVRENPLAAALIGIAALLVIVLLILLVVWLRRRRANQNEALDFSTSWPTGGTSSPSNPAFGAAPAQTAGPMSAPSFGPGAPTQMPGATPGMAPTQMPGMTPDMAPGQRPSAPTQFIPRGPKAPQHVALLVDRKNLTRQFTLQQNTSVGRANENAVVLGDNTTVSRSHARIWLEGDRFKIHDLDSANGTFVNGTRIRQPQMLQDGDVVRFGELEFMFKQLS